jgi:hypothetical protein
MKPEKLREVSEGLSMARDLGNLRQVSILIHVEVLEHLFLLLGGQRLPVRSNGPSVQVSRCEYSCRGQFLGGFWSGSAEASEYLLETSFQLRSVASAG